MSSADGLKTEIIRRNDLGDVELYDHEKATKRKYRKGNKVRSILKYLLLGKRGSFSTCLRVHRQKFSQQNNILPPFVIRERRIQMGSPNSCYCHVEGNYYGYVDTGIRKGKSSATPMRTTGLRGRRFGSTAPSPTRWKSALQSASAFFRVEKLYR